MLTNTGSWGNEMKVNIHSKTQLPVTFDTGKKI